MGRLSSHTYVDDKGVKMKLVGYRDKREHFDSMKVIVYDSPEYAYLRITTFNW